MANWRSAPEKYHNGKSVVNGKNVSPSTFVHPGHPVWMPPGNKWYSWCRKS